MILLGCHSEHSLDSCGLLCNHVVQLLLLLIQKKKAKEISPVVQKETTIDTLFKVWKTQKVKLVVRLKDKHRLM